MSDYILHSRVRVSVLREGVRELTGGREGVGGKEITGGRDEGGREGDDGREGCLSIPRIQVETQPLFV